MDLVVLVRADDGTMMGREPNQWALVRADVSEQQGTMMVQESNLWAPVRGDESLESWAVLVVKIREHWAETEISLAHELMRKTQRE